MRFFIMIMDVLSLVGVLLMLLIIPIGIIVHYRRKIAFITVQLEEMIESFDVAEHPVPTMNERDRLAYDKELLLFIDDLIVTELINCKRKELFLEKGKKDIDFDNVIKTVADAVFNGIKPEILASPENILTTEYLAKYIAKRTILSYFKYLEDKVAHTI